jgi:histidinol dehydrogenase
MKTYVNPEKESWSDILRRPMYEISELHNRVGSILNTIRLTGEKALHDFTLEFDGVEITNWLVTAEEFDQAEEQVEDRLKEAIRLAAANIGNFHKVQLQPVQKMETMPGVWCWQKTIPIEKVGLYIPGGSAPLFSTVLMLAIPSKLAGCREIILCTPPAKDGSVHPAILFAARLAGVTQVFKLGGIQAIGAMAYGVVTPKVDKIFGPGNQYVMAAKQLVSFQEVAIDMPAGPSEVAILADRTSHPAFVAADLLSQAEHGPDSQVLLILKEESLLTAIQNEVEKQLNELPRKEIAKQALENSRIIICNQDQQMIDLVNWYAPEHLIISTNNYGEMAAKIKHAGSVFLGNYTPESAGDYASGTNHTLPTNGWARSYSGINMDSFVKKLTFQEITISGIKNLGPFVETLSEAEELEGHKNAVTIRLKHLENIGR